MEDKLHISLCNAKKGDILVYEQPVHRYVFMFKRIEDDVVKIYCYLCLDDEKSIPGPSFCITDEFVHVKYAHGHVYYATDDEKNALMSNLNKNALMWDDDENDIVPFRFKSGKWYQCIRDYNCGLFTFLKDKFYYSDKDDFIVDEYKMRFASTDPNKDAFKVIPFGHPPFFKGNDWIKSNNDANQYTYRVLEVTKDEYYLEDADGNENHLKIDFVDKRFSPWTIKDAKNGDILACDVYDNERALVIIFKQYVTSDWGDKLLSYCHVTAKTGEFSPIGIGHATDKWRPASYYETIDFFNKVDDAGYYWDNKTNSLIEKNPFKFKAGDIITNGNNIFTVESIDKDSGTVKSHQCGAEFVYSSKDLENFRLWNIDDIKPGDVVYKPKGAGVEVISIICSFGSYNGQKTWQTRCTYRVEDDELVAGGPGVIHMMNFVDPMYPATYEQKIKLFEKINEFGYIYVEKTYSLKCAKYKYKIGDYIVLDDDPSIVNKITKIDGLNYGSIFLRDGRYVEHCASFIEKFYHLWTIKDAKKDDIICFKLENGKKNLCSLKSDGNLNFDWAVSDGQVSDDEIFLNEHKIAPASSEEKERYLEKTALAGLKFNSSTDEFEREDNLLSDSEIEEMFKSFWHTKPQVVTTEHIYKQGIADALEKIKLKKNGK